MQRDEKKKKANFDRFKLIVKVVNNINYSKQKNYENSCCRSNRDGWPHYDESP
jgi:hypothetical protein